MRSASKVLCLCACILAFLGDPVMAWAAGSASLELLHDFAVTPVPYWPTAILRAPDGNFYGTLQFGGPTGYGALFRMTPQGVATSLYYFDLERDGGRPQSLTLTRDGTLYGTTSPCSNEPYYSCYGSVTVFQATLDGTVSVLHRFDTAFRRAFANPLLEASDGQVYGTTDSDVFRIDAASHVAVVHHFTDAGSLSPLMQASNALLYFTRLPQGNTARVYAIALDGTLRVDRALGLESALVQAPLAEGADGMLYGTASCNRCNYDADGPGYLFRITLEGAVSLLQRFGTGDSAPWVPTGPLIASADGNLYGLASYGPYAGSIIRITSAGAVTAIQGLSHPSDLVATAEGLGSSARGGRNPSGLVMFDGRTFIALMANRLVEARLDGSVETIHTFTGGRDLRSPRAMIRDQDGLLRGLAFTGAVGPPAVFTMTPDGAITAIHELDVRFCDCPRAFLVRADDGAVWVSDGLSTIVRMAPDGSYRRVGGGRVEAMAPDADGAVVYGSSSRIMRLARDGSTTLLHEFDTLTPIDALVRADDGRVYGLAEWDNPDAAGSLFSIDSTGRFSLLHSFAAGAAGQGPRLLALGSQRQLYGATSQDFPRAGGWVFRFDPQTGRMNVLGTIPGYYNLDKPVLTAGPAGAYFIDSFGSFFRIGNSGERVQLGVWPVLQSVTWSIWTGAGTFYANTATGGSGQGAIYRLTVPVATDTAPTMMVRNPATGAVVQWRLRDAVVAGDLILPDVPDRAWQLVTMADVTGDGRADAIWHHLATGATVVWSIGDGAVQQISLPTVPDRAWHLVASADLNQDGAPDLVWRNYQTGANAVWFLRGTTLIGQASLPAVEDLAWELVAAADMNTDGSPDLLWRRARTGENAIWYLRGTTLVGQANLPRVTDPAWMLRQPLDVDDDGRPDLVWQHRTLGSVVSWSVRNATIVGTRTLAIIDGAWALAGADLNTLQTDVDGDRHPDLLWRNTSTGADVTWTMAGTSRLAQIELPAVPDAGWQLVGRWDFNGDTHPDLVWRHSVTGANRLWLMSGPTKVAERVITTVMDASWEIQTVADLDRDGRPELVWRNTTTGANVVWYLSAVTLTMSFPVEALRQEALPPVGDPSWRIVASADLNGDQYPDLLWRNSTTGANKVWYMNGAYLAGQADLPAVPDTSWRVAMAADINGDEWPDLVWRNAATGENVVWYLRDAAVLDTASLPTVPDTNWVLAP